MSRTVPTRAVLIPRGELLSRLSVAEQALQMVDDEMSRYYRDGRHPDLAPMHRNAKRALRVLRP